MAEISLSNNVGFALVFLEGFLSFFSPCVLPLIPVYISYLSGNGRKIGLDNTVIFERKIVFLNTLFFVLGISSVFFLLGLSFSTLGTFFNQNKVLFSSIGGIIIMIMGFYQLDLINLNFLKVERKIYFDFSKKRINPFIAFIMGFTFSFAWTPCVGPALSSVLILASTSKFFTGNLFVLIYTLGFIIPFILLGLFTTETLNFFNKKRNLVKYTIKAGGIILVIIGFMTLTGTFGLISRNMAF